MPQYVLKISRFDMFENISADNKISGLGCSGIADDTRIVVFYVDPINTLHDIRQPALTASVIEYGREVVFPVVVVDELSPAVPSNPPRWFSVRQSKRSLVMA